ncbi:uncharacterized protein KY384_004960 [Bacidia gigantensis]|uniref:uncharacterized protein n=1 Tax=Bacidia gigantensis TaxID=2732470 RepID=UPI001D044C1C|nr:uncharacterized protein KY384_004960 [Bacidia gigantensis]KAG8530458.1 hypothetical protein KY384_004960 [Bacidia gigantensis]
MSFQDENAIDNSSPSVVDSGSPETLNDVIFEGQGNVSTPSEWHQPSLAQAPLRNGFSSGASQQPFMDLPMVGAPSPKTTSVQAANTDPYFSTSPPFPPETPSQMFDVNPFLMSDNPVKPETPSNSAASISSSNCHSSVTSMSTDSISDATRQALINSLSEPLVQGHGFMRTTFPPNHSTASDFLAGKTFPSTQDLQRYVAAYIRYFHPHLPFLHVATLAFDAPAFTSDLSSSGHQAFEQSNVLGGAGSLVLAMASIGALYEYDFAPSKDLSEMSKHMIQLYLQERSRADSQNASCIGSNGVEMNSQNTPLWLVQAMLLNVIYGHNSGDKKSASIANTQCASLISLARGADLVRPTEADITRSPEFQLKQTDLQLNNDDPAAWSGYISHPALELEKEWHLWKVIEERKRTLYAIFTFSSLLVSAYNSAPALMNSEILLDLPCDERLWSADSAETWRSFGGSAVASQKETSFAGALRFLLSASQRKQQKQRRMSHSFDMNIQPESLPEEELRPSTFGCLILINALHNYIWETRQHHAGRPWTPRDTEKLHAHMEPALRAWQAAWSSNSDHSLERPNPFGATSMSADCIPLLDLAYVRLFVNLGRTKDLFFQRNWDAMAEELANGPEIVEHGEHSPASSPRNSEKTSSAMSNELTYIKMQSGAPSAMPETTLSQCSAKCSRRERHLRKAAYCAANSLMMSDRLNVTFADYNSRELPLHSALCAFDCAQILAEWISTVQQRVGRYIGILGRDVIDLSQAPACMFLEDDDCKLLEKVKEIIDNANAKLSSGISMIANPNMTNDSIIELENCGYGSKILSMHARMFEREAVWPVCHEMSLALRTQATHIKTKTEMSLNVLA